MLSSGSRDKHILQHDLRASKDYVSKLVGHRSEVELTFSDLCNKSENTAN